MSHCQKFDDLHLNSLYYSHFVLMWYFLKAVIFPGLVLTDLHTTLLNMWTMQELKGANTLRPEIKGPVIDDVLKVMPHRIYIIYTWGSELIAVCVVDVWKITSVITSVVTAGGGVRWAGLLHGSKTDSDSV